MPTPQHLGQHHRTLTRTHQHLGHHYAVIKSSVSQWVSQSVDGSSVFSPHRRKQRRRRLACIRKLHFHTTMQVVHNLILWTSSWRPIIALVVVNIIMLGSFSHAFLRLSQNSHTLRFRYGLQYTSSIKRLAVPSASFSLSSAACSTALEDNMLTGLNDAQDVMIRVVSVQQLLQSYLDRMPLSDLAARSFGEAAACTLLMGSSMKGQETLQVNIVGTTGLKSITVITDADLHLRGRVGEPSFSLPGSMPSSLFELVGETGQIQVMRNHPTFKSPATGITALRDTSIAYNLALYLAESEQRTAALLTDVSVVQGRCAHALAVLMERLPGCTDEKIESAIANLQTVQQKTLSSYLQDSVAAIPPTSSSTHTALDRILDDCLISMDADSIRWSKKPSLRCYCSRDRLLSALRLLSAKDKEELLQENKLIETKCEFCGTKYGVSIEEMKAL